MTLDQLWQAIVTGGTGFFLFVGLVLFFRGDLVNGGVARQARQDALDEQRRAYDEQIALMRQRYEEMQGTWKERCGEQTKERDYYRTIALSISRQTEEALALAKNKPLGL